MSSKSIGIIEKWMKEHGNRIAGVKMIDNVLKQRIGIESADLPDTSTFANGLDAIEEGGEGLMQENDEEEPSEDAFYVEYLKEMPGEKPFMLHGEKFQYVKAKYPDGKEDIGVYAFRGDLVYGYKAFRKRYNLK